MNIHELAKQAGLVRNGDIGMKRWEGPQSDSISDQDLEKFAALVEAAARADEREACAKLCMAVPRNGEYFAYLILERGTR